MSHLRCISTPEVPGPKCCLDQSPYSVREEGDELADTQVHASEQDDLDDSSGNLAYFEHFRRIGPIVQSAERRSVQSALHLDTCVSNSSSGLTVPSGPSRQGEVFSIQSPTGGAGVVDMTW